MKKGFLIHYYECRDNIVKSLIQNGIITSGYTKGQTDSNGNVIEKPSGKCSHGGVTIDSSRHTLNFDQGGINKDGPYYRTSPHYYLHDEAIAVAQQATIDMLSNLRRDVNNDQRFGEYLGVFQSQATIENSINIPIDSQAYLRGKIRNILLQHHMGRIDGKKKITLPLDTLMRVSFNISIITFSVTSFRMDYFVIIILCYNGFEFIL